MAGMEGAHTGRGGEEAREVRETSKGRLREQELLGRGGRMGSVEGVSHRFRYTGVLLQKLHHAVRQLRGGGRGRWREREAEREKWIFITKSCPLPITCTLYLPQGYIFLSLSLSLSLPPSCPTCLSLTLSPLLVWVYLGLILGQRPCLV